MTNTVQHLGRMGIRRRAVNGALALAILLLSPVVTTRPAQAQTFTVLHSFTGAPDGAYPLAGLIRDAAGNLYGTTASGGGLTSCAPTGCGTVFKLDVAGKKTVLHNFTGADGAAPVAGLIRDAAGNLYGTTEKGGALRLGTVFKLDATGKLEVLHSFSGADGAGPVAGLIRDAAGNLYGTTPRGGTGNGGVVFKLDTSGTLAVLHSFPGADGDGATPLAGLIRDAAGNLYGTTLTGAYGGTSYFGTVFKLDVTGKETILYSFGGVDGAFPGAGLIRDAAGNLYGTTQYGGTSDFGTVFKLDVTGKETVLYSFAGVDGYNPSGRVIRDSAGNLYSTTRYGGDYNSGTAFKLDATGKETVLHSFAGSDGVSPYAGLIRDAAGNLYGTAVFGGASGYGTVFKLAP